MKKTATSPATFLILLASILFLISCQSNTPTPNKTPIFYNNYPVYKGTDLGLKYRSKVSSFKIWTPSAEAVKLRLYAEGTGGQAIKEYDLKQQRHGTWNIKIKEDLKGQFYTFQIYQDGKWWKEVADPYAKAVGINGERAMVIDLKETNPKGWRRDKSPQLKRKSDIVLYELHIRDISMHPESGIQHKGKFLGLAETDTKNSEYLATGLDHVKEMGVTHVHLLPVFDFMYLDETKLDKQPYNWGYAPQHFNVPEGSYSTNPYDGAVRVREFKQMVKALHDNGIRVIMDVVYNHTGATEESNFNQLVPGYYYRQKDTGGFSNASACGNEMASERPMVQKFMVESLAYWVKEYHIDGFRFDLMGIHDIETMNLISAKLRKIKPSIFLYGEGWTAGESPLPETEQALKKNTHRLRQIAAFSDDMRDGVKGHVFTPSERGFATGKYGMEESVKFGIVAALPHPQVNYDSVNYSKSPWAKEPTQCINYVSCHDNHTLWDKINLSNAEFDETQRMKMQRLANMIVLTSQGIPFLHAGVEFLRSKQGVENSFESPDSINQIDWSHKSLYQENVEYYKVLIQLRKNHPAFRLSSNKMLQAHLRFLSVEQPRLIAYTIGDYANGDTWKKILVILNGNFDSVTVDIPLRDWVMVANANSINEEGIDLLEQVDKIEVAGSSGMVLVER